MPDAGALPVVLASCDAGSLPADLHWLGPRERETLDRLRLFPRRRSFLLGRMAAKRALAWSASRDTPLGALQVMPAGDGAPEAYLRGQRMPVSLAISHSGARGVAAVVAGRVPLGVDIEALEPRSPGLLLDFFTDAEREAIDRVASPGPLLPNLVWSAKESALKALRQGLRADTRTIEVTVPALGDPGRDGSDGWRPLAARQVGGVDFAGWWRSDGRMVCTVLSTAPLTVPLDAGA